MDAAFFRNHSVYAVFYMSHVFLTFFAFPRCWHFIGEKNNGHHAFA